jgi:hypothetical protein
MSATTANEAVTLGRHARKGDGWVVLLYILTTLVVNMGALLAVPKFATPAAAEATLPYYALPVIWGAYLLLRYWAWPLLRWVSYIAGLLALFWFSQVIFALVLVMRK